jgi:hypothetical protein
MTIEKLPDDLLRNLANVQLHSITTTCQMMTAEDVLIYLDYVVTGLAAFREGFTGAEA